MRWQGYRIPLRRVHESASATMAVREGLIVWVEDADGRVGIGECAPLPSFDGATVADCDAALRLESGLQPAVRAALETAMHDLGDSFGPPVRRAVPLNAVVATTDTAAAVAQAACALQEGFTCVKLKVALPGDRDRVDAVRASIGPGAELRLDANGGWTEAEAISNLKALARYDIAFVEQPIPPGDVAALARVRRGSPIPVAADEGVRDVLAARGLLEAQAVDVLVIKPSLVGGPAIARAIAERAHAAGVGVVITSAMESGVGIASALHVAAGLPEPALACGLATASALEHDLLRRPIQIVDGQMTGPTGPGLGVELDEEALERYATDLRGEVRL